MMMFSKDLFNKYFLISCSDIKKLHGYATQNYLVDDESGNKFILKHYDKNTIRPDVLSYENETLLFLAKHLPNKFPTPIANKKKAFITKTRDGNYLRLLSYVEGNFFDKVTHTPKLYASLGHFLASMNKVLQPLKTPGLSAREINWDLQHFLMNEPLLKHIENHEVRKIIKYFILCYQQEVLPNRYKLRRSIIHGDANEQNILVNNGEVSAMIDFGDFCYSPLINELSIALTYAIQDKEEPLAWANIIIKAYQQILPLSKEEIALLPTLIAARICTSLLNSAYARTHNPENTYVSSSEDAMLNLLNKWITLNPRKIKKEFLTAAGFHNNSHSIDIENERKRRSNYFSKNYSLSYSKPIKMERAAFQYMYDAEGNTFLDAYNNIPLIGHSHPAITEAAQKQIAHLNTNTRYFYDALHEYAENFLSKFPSKLNKVFFVNSGSAASDLAVRLAAAYSSKMQIAVIEEGYHGNTFSGINISAYKAEGKGGNGLPAYVHKLPLPDTYLGKYKGQEAGEKYAKEAINYLSNLKNLPGAFIAEPIVGCGGQIPLPEGYLSTLYPYLKKNGIVCISDEVQVGMGRLGNVFWGFEKQNLIPDIVIIGKPIGNGHPLGAVVCTEEIAQAFENGMEFFSSFGGNPVSCVIGNTVLKVLKEEALQNNAFETGNYLIENFRSLEKNHPLIGDVRGSGLFIGVEMLDTNGNRSKKAGFNASIIKNKLRENFILSSTDGPFDSVLKFKPPLCFNKNNVDQLLESFDKIVNQADFD